MHLGRDSSPFHGPSPRRWLALSVLLWLVSCAGGSEPAPEGAAPSLLSRFEAKIVDDAIELYYQLEQHSGIIQQCFQASVVASAQERLADGTAVEWKETAERVCGMAGMRAPHGP